jgi:hypothetical protein
LSFALGDEPRVVGRGPDCSIRIDELDVSLRHAEIRGFQSAHYLSDLGSESGTFVAGARLMPGREVSLEENVALRFGSIDAVYTRAALVLQTLMLAPRARLFVAAGSEQGQSIALSERAVVGSQAGSDLRLRGFPPAALEIARTIRGFWARALGSGSVFRSGAPLGSEYTLLAHGDILLGPGGVMLRFEELE